METGWCWNLVQNLSTGVRETEPNWPDIATSQRWSHQVSNGKHSYTDGVRSELPGNDDHELLLLSALQIRVMQVHSKRILKIRIERKKQDE